MEKKKKKVTARVLDQKMIAPDIYDMWLLTELAQDALAGQFIGVYPKDKSTLLPRPISICEVDREKSALRIVYRVAGKGTDEFSGYSAGEEVDILGILGNGFPVEEGQDSGPFGRRYRYPAYGRAGKGTKRERYFRDRYRRIS